MLKKSFAAFCILNLLGSTVQAATADEVAAVNAKISADSLLVSQWTTSQFKYAIPFNSTSGNVIPSQLKIFGFEAGVEGVVSATKLDVDGFRNLNTSLVDTKSIDMFSRLPIPMILGHAKIGLPFGLDAGIRLGGIPEKNIDKDDTKIKIKNKVVGLDLRKKIIEEGAVKPFGLTLGLNYTHADGSLDITNTYSSLSTTVDVNGTPHTASIQDGLTAQHTSWKTNSVGLQAILDKQIFFITPYLGASVNRNSGDIHNSISTTGTPVIDGTADPSDPISGLGTSTEKANKWDVRALLGFDFSLLPFIRLGIHGEYAGSKNAAGDIGLRVQFR